MTNEQIAIVGASMHFTRSFYQNKIATPAGDLYGNNETALRANEAAERALSDMIHREGRLVAALASLVESVALNLDDQEAEDLATLEVARAVLSEVIQ